MGDKLYKGVSHQYIHHLHINKVYSRGKQFLVYILTSHLLNKEAIYKFHLGIWMVILLDSQI